MGILDILLSRKNKNDKPVVKTEVNTQDMIDALTGKNGKTTVQGIGIDTVTMRELPMRSKSSGIITSRGIVTSTQYFNRSHNENSDSDFIILAKVERADLLELIIGQKVFEVPNDHFLPEVSIGDDIEIMHWPDSYKAITPNSSGRDVQTVWVLKNHTNGTLWCFNTRRHVLGF